MSHSPYQNGGEMAKFKTDEEAIRFLEESHLDYTIVKAAKKVFVFFHLWKGEGKTVREAVSDIKEKQEGLQRTVSKEWRKP